MAEHHVLEPGGSYTFRSYFEMPYEPEDILAEFGYRLERSLITLPETTAELPQIEPLQQKLRQRLRYVSLTSEAARREILIAPVLLEVVEIAQAQLRIEYPLTVNERLKGSLDYYLYSDRQFVVIEAKNADLTRGFTQLAVEMIALDQWTTSEQPELLGAVTTGDVWQFGRLNRADKLITQITQLYRVPDDLDAVLRILLAAISANEM